MPAKLVPPVCLLPKKDIRPTFRRERAAFKRGVWPVAGCDEAGRGPLAGPVVAAAVNLYPNASRAASMTPRSSIRKRAKSST